MLLVGREKDGHNGSAVRDGERWRGMDGDMLVLLVVRVELVDRAAVV